MARSSAASGGVCANELDIADIVREAIYRQLKRLHTGCGDSDSFQFADYSHRTPFGPIIRLDQEVGFRREGWRDAAIAENGGRSATNQVQDPRIQMEILNASAPLFQAARRLDRGRPARNK